MKRLSWFRYPLLCALLGTVLGACAPASIDGNVDEYEYGKVRTAFFDTYEDSYGSFLSIVLYDHEFTCEELQAAFDAGDSPSAGDGETLIGAMSFTIAQYMGDGIFSVDNLEGDYKVFDIYDTSDYFDLSNGDRVAYVYSAFYIDPEEAEIFDTAEVGTVTITKADLEKRVAGEFDITLSDTGGELSGDFKVEPCSFYTTD